MLVCAGAARAATPPCSQYDPTHKLETPCNTELLNTTRYQLRLYGLPMGQSFSTAALNATSWLDATHKGFEANFAYIEGANAQSVKIPMTAPVVTRNPGADEASWLVSFFTPQSIYPTAAAAPQPTGEGMSIEAMPLSTFAVVEFGGEATEATYKVAANLLKDALKEDNIKLADSTDPWAESWCGYDAVSAAVVSPLSNPPPPLYLPSLLTYPSIPPAPHPSFFVCSLMICFIGTTRSGSRLFLSRS